MNILASQTILTSKVRNQRLFWNFDTSRDYCDHSFIFRD